MENEWRLLGELSAANPELLGALDRDADDFELILEGTQAFGSRPRSFDLWQASLRARHQVRIFFPRFYPAMPAEVYVAGFTYHPNAHPDTGFVCLWERHRAVDTVSRLLTQLQAILSGRLFNRDERHVMQPDALEFYLRPEVSELLPLPSSPLLVAPPPDSCWDRTPVRRRLS